MGDQSRRGFLKRSGSILGGSWLGINLPLVIAAAQTACSRREAGESWVNLSEHEAEVLAAVADQIIPADDTPGASEAGVVYFIDTAMGSFFAQNAAKLRDGIEDLDTRAGVNGFAALNFSEQTGLLKNVQDTWFFLTMLNLTRMGMFALPEYGGNKDHAGWKLLGFEHRHVWQAPFGYYDEQFVTEESENAIS